MCNHLDASPALRARLERPQHRAAAEKIGWGIELRTGACEACKGQEALTYLGLCGPCFKAAEVGDLVKGRSGAWRPNMADRSTEQPAAPECALGSLNLVLLIHAEQVPPGVEAWHIREYLSAFIENREPNLHEDILDRMPDIQASVLGNAPVVIPAGRPCATCGGTGYHLDRHETPCLDCAGKALAGSTVGAVAGLSMVVGKHSTPKCELACIAWFSDPSLCNRCDGRGGAAS